MNNRINSSNGILIKHLQNDKAGNKFISSHDRLQNYDRNLSIVMKNKIVISE